MRRPGEPTSLAVTRWAAGVVFVLFGIGKFVAHDSELASFRHYGLPLPEVAVILVGLVEIVGGALLLSGRLVRPAAIVLAGNMIGAIVVSGIGRGEVVPSLTLAPLLLAAMVFLVVAGRGAPRA